MTTYMGPAWSDEPNQNKYVISKELTTELIEHFSPVPVRLNFEGDPVGTVQSLQRLGDVVVCMFELFPGVYTPRLGDKLAPMIVVDEAHIDGSNLVATKGRLYEISITQTPADSRITPFEPKENVT